MRFAGCFLGRADALPYDRNSDIAVQPEESESMFWAGVHKEILQISSAPPEVKERSVEWLVRNGFTAGPITLSEKSA